MSGTMLELHDTQMSDYPTDIDVPMHSSIAEYWFHTEVTMEDEGHHLHMPKVSHESTSVEVDMEPYDGERDGIEYEMADEAGHYDLESGDVEDVDLYDTLRTHTPADPAFEIDAIAIPTDGTDDAHTSPSLLATSLASADIQTAHEADPSNAIHTSTEEMPVTLSPHPDAHLDDGVSYTEGRDLSPSDSHEKFTREDPSRDVLQPLVSIDGLVNSSTENDHDSVLAVPAADEVGASAQKAERDEISPHFEDHIVPPTAQTPDLVESVGLQQPADDLNNHPEVRIGASGDPLEISEGVYIDPPPAVLLSLPSSNDPKICLFNHPHLSSGSTTPSPGGTENTEQTLTLLLHHLPTLYYEPLASVFEALRQEESITQIAGCVDGELVLDAYDLHLAISEDNIYAREITLHDLNVIHDGSDISGPLRLQLQLVLPRFIIRYHSLRDQISRLNLATDIGEDHNELVREEHSHEDTFNQEKTRGHAHDTQNADEFNDQGHRLQESEVPESYCQEATENAKHSEEAIGDTSNFSTEVHGVEVETTDPLGNYAAGSEDIRPLEDEIEYADADESEYTSEDLDAHTIHDGVGFRASAPVDAEYTEYDEYAEPREDDGTYGEAAEDPGDQQTFDCTESAEYTALAVVNETLTTLPDVLGEFAEVQSVTPVEGEVIYPAWERSDTDKDDGNVEGSSKLANLGLEDEGFDVTGHNSPTIELPDLEIQQDVDESDSHSVVHENENNVADRLLGSSYSEQHTQEDVTIVNPDPYDDEWDDSLDGEGEPDINWEAEHDDIASNESSITLSSSASKRRYDEVDSEGAQGSLPDSPGLKRPRVE